VHWHRNLRNLGVLLSKLDCKALLQEAVKFLQRFLTMRVSASAVIASQKPESYAMLAGELLEKLDQFSAYDRKYMTGYIQRLVDARNA
jgi:hypothetical protein